MDERNISETFLPGEAPIKATYLPGEEERPDEAARSRREPLTIGQTFTGGYVVTGVISESGSQAAIYIVRREGKLRALKLYDRGCMPDAGFTQSLVGHDCAYVAKLIECGMCAGSYYEISDYFEQGTLEKKGKCTTSFICDTVVPDINEGLRFLHTFGKNGIVHGDIKPDNIFVSNDTKHVIIGDFGICAYLDGQGRHIDEIKGTPEYAPPTVTFFGKATKTPAYDYASFGLMLIKLCTGHSAFENLDIVQIAEKWEKGVRVPDSIDSRLRRLIEGLIVQDERTRFGYNEVKAWCEGEYVKALSSSLYSLEDLVESSEPKPLLFGIFGDRIITVGTLHELARAMADNWEHSKKLIKHVKFHNFITQFDPKLAKSISDYSSTHSEDESVFTALYSVYPLKELVYKGRTYGSAYEFVNTANQSGDPDALELISSGLFTFFVRRLGMDATVVGKVQELSGLGAADAKLAAAALASAFAPEKKCSINGVEIREMDELAVLMCTMSPEDIEELCKNDELLAWLYSMGCVDTVNKIKGSSGGKA